MILFAFIIASFVYICLEFVFASHSVLVCLTQVRYSSKGYNWWQLCLPSHNLVPTPMYTISGFIHNQWKMLRLGHFHNICLSIALDNIYTISWIGYSLAYLGSKQYRFLTSHLHQVAKLSQVNVWSLLYAVFSVLPKSKDIKSPDQFHFEILTV